MESIDSQLIALLSRNGRQDMAGLAVKLGVSIQTVRRKFEKLMNQQAIQIVGAVDPAKVGSPFSVMMGLKLAPHRVGAAMRELGTKRCVLTVFSTIGPYDAWASLWFKHPRELAEFIQNELPVIKGIERTETFLLLSAAKSTYTTLDPRLIESPVRDLISLLQENGRRKNSELADILKVSRVTVGRQIKQLEKMGVIQFRGVPVVRDDEIRALLGIRTKVGSVKSVVATLMENPSVLWMNTTTGRYDIFLTAKFKDVREMAYFITSNVSRIYGVELVESALVTEYRFYYQARHDEYWASKPKYSSIRAESPY